MKDAMAPCVIRLPIRILAALVLMLLLNLQAKQLRSQTIPELVQLLEDREALLNKYSVKVDSLRSKWRGPHHGEVPRTNGVLNHGALPEWIMYRYQRAIQMDGLKWRQDIVNDLDISLAPQRERSAFDGKLLSRLYGTIDQWHTGIISESNGREAFDGSISELISGAVQPWSVGVAKFAEQVQTEKSLLRVTFPPQEYTVGDKVFATRGSMFFDPTHGFAPVRQGFESRTGDNWSLTREMQVEEFYTHKSGVSLPKVAIWSEFDFENTNGKGVGMVMDKSTYTFSDWVLGDIDREQTYRVPFPPQVLVRDERVGKELRAMDLTDWEIENEVANVPKFTSGARNIILLILGLLVVIGIWLFWRRQSSVR